MISEFTQSPRRTTEGVIENQVVLGVNGGFDISVPQPPFTPDPDHPIVRDVSSTFDASNFAEPRQNIPLGTVDLEQAPKHIEINSLPIKFPGASYRIPVELTGVQGAIELAASFEHAINPNISEYYAFLTLVNSDVRLTERQRGSAIHSDSIQGPRIQPKAPIDRCYGATTHFPTIFFEQPFDVTDINPDVHFMEPVFTYQADRAAATQHPANMLVLFDTYSVHQADEATEDVNRTFFRLNYSIRPQDRQGNSYNTLFEEEYQKLGWVFQPRPVPASLIIPPWIPIG